MGQRQASAIIQVQFLGTVLNQLSALAADQTSAAFGTAISAITLSTGSDADQINRAVSIQALNFSSGEIKVIDVFDFAGLDMGAGVANDQLGQALALDRIVGILAVLAPGSNCQMLIGGEGSGAAWSNLFGGNDNAKIGIRSTPNTPGIFLALDPSAVAFPVVDTTNHLLKLEASGGAGTLAFFLIARDET